MGDARNARRGRPGPVPRGPLIVEFKSPRSRRKRPELSKSAVAAGLRHELADGPGPRDVVAELPPAVPDEQLPF